MAVAYQNNINTNQQIVWRMTEICPSEYFGDFGDFDKQSTGGNLRLLISNKKFINYQLKFQEQFNRLKQYFDGMGIVEAKLKFSSSLSPILYLNPDSLSMELTYEKSIFYTIKKGIYTIFIQHNLDIENEEDDEAILSIFKNDEKLPSCAGGLATIMQEASSVIRDSIEYRFEPTSNIYELSY